jgi:hypothetical protein
VSSIRVGYGQIGTGFHLQVIYGNDQLTVIAMPVAA